MKVGISFEVFLQVWGNGHLWRTYLNSSSSYITFYPFLFCWIHLNKDKPWWMVRSLQWENLTAERSQICLCCLNSKLLFLTEQVSISAAGSQVTYIDSVDEILSTVLLSLCHLLGIPLMWGVFSRQKAGRASSNTSLSTTSSKEHVRWGGGVRRSSWSSNMFKQCALAIPSWYIITQTSLTCSQG